MAQKTGQNNVSVVLHAWDQLPSACTFFEVIMTLHVSCFILFVNPEVVCMKGA